MTLIVSQRSALRAGHTPYTQLLNRIHITAQPGFTIIETEIQKLVAFGMESARLNGALNPPSEAEGGWKHQFNK